MPRDYPTKHRGRMYSELDQAILARLESLEHLSNQHDILLTALLDTIIQSSEASTSTGSGSATYTELHKDT